MQRVVVVSRIEEEQRQVRIVEKQRVDQSIIRLSGQVPQDGLALCAVGSYFAELVEQPELLAVGRGVFLKLAVGQAPAEPGLADARIPHQDNLGAGVGDRWRSGLTEQDGWVEFPNVDDTIPVIF